MDQTQLQNKLARLMPPPAPTSGWGLARIMSAANLLGPVADDRMAEAEAELVLGATIDDGEIVADPDGASGLWLDRWGAAFGVPRYLSETDESYGPRILAEVVNAGSTNYGMAGLIDRLLGISGTQVLDGDGFFSVYRLNDGHRLNGNHRLAWFSGYNVGDLWSTFVVILPSLPEGRTVAEVRTLINRRRAAGVRCLAITFAQITE